MRPPSNCRRVCIAVLAIGIAITTNDIAWAQEQCQVKDDKLSPDCRAACSKLDDGGVCKNDLRAFDEAIGKRDTARTGYHDALVKAYLGVMHDATNGAKFQAQRGATKYRLDQITELLGTLQAPSLITKPKALDKALVEAAGNEDKDPFKANLEEVHKALRELGRLADHKAGFQSQLGMLACLIDNSACPWAPDGLVQLVRLPPDGSAEDNVFSALGQSIDTQLKGPSENLYQAYLRTTVELKTKSDGLNRAVAGIKVDEPRGGTGSGGDTKRAPIKIVKALFGNPNSVQTAFDSFDDKTYTYLKTDDDKDKKKLGHPKANPAGQGSDERSETPSPKLPSKLPSNVCVATGNFKALCENAKVVLAVCQHRKSLEVNFRGKGRCKEATKETPPKDPGEDEVGETTRFEPFERTTCDVSVRLDETCGGRNPAVNQRRLAKVEYMCGTKKMAPKEAWEGEKLYFYCD